MDNGMIPARNNRGDGGGNAEAAIFQNFSGCSGNHIGYLAHGIINIVVHGS
jgi:hypothetical protein